MRLDVLGRLELRQGRKPQAGGVRVRADDLDSGVVRVELRSDGEGDDRRAVSREEVLAA